MGNIFSDGGAPQGNNHFVATGHGVYTNEKGETIHDSFQHVNGEFTRQTSTSNLPPPTGFLQPQPGHVGWMGGMAPVAAAIMLLLIVVLFIYSRQTKRSVKRNIAVINDSEMVANNPIPLYSLNNKKSQHPSNAMWNIDLLDEEDNLVRV